MSADGRCTLADGVQLLDDPNLGARGGVVVRALFFRMSSREHGGRCQAQLFSRRTRKGQGPQNMIHSHDKFSHTTRVGIGMRRSAWLGQRAARKVSGARKTLFLRRRPWVFRACFSFRVEINHSLTRRLRSMPHNLRPSTNTPFLEHANRKKRHHSF